MRDRYTVMVGLAFAVVIVIAVVKGGGGGGPILGLDEQPRNWPLPSFAVPLAVSDLEGDANVAQDDCETSRLPCPREDVRTPACRVEDPGAFRVCDLFAKPSVISFWFRKDGSCVTQQDAVDQVYGRYRGRVSFLSLDIGDGQDEVAELVRDRGWSMPVGVDGDGAVGALYRVGGCPTLAYVLPGGILQGTSVGELGPERLAARVDELIEASAEAEAGEGA